MTQEQITLKAIYEIVLLEYRHSKRVSKAIKHIHDEIIMLSDKMGISTDELKKQLNVKI